MAAPSEEDDDCWNAFGSDDNDDDDDEDHQPVTTICEQGVLWLTQHFLRWNPQIPLSQRRVFSTDKDWTAALQARGFQVMSVPTELYDAGILDSVDTSDSEQVRLVRRNVVPNGVLMTVGGSSSSQPSSLDNRVWLDPETVCEHVIVKIKHSCPINETSCPWIPSTHSLHEERRLVSQATVTRSAHELATNTRKLNEHDVQRASTCLTKYGYCVVRKLVDPSKCLEWGCAIFKDLHEASQILKARNHVDIMSPGVDTTNYRELAMREDLRMDLRDGPHLRKLRQDEHNHFAEWGIMMLQHPADSSNPSALPIITTSSGSLDSCLRFHSDILEIARRTMNPQDSVMCRGNFGRYNFDGSGPDGSYQPLRIGPMGGIVSLPGSADQALHADTPHLFEHVDCLPAHYINAFCLGVDVGVETDADGSATGATPVGGTVFVHDSHRLSFTAEMEQGDGRMEKKEMLKHLVRPSLELGDVVLFDCRILHFGLANNSKDVERPLLYTNMTHAWFHDPKNWNDRQQIFVYK